MTRYRLFRLLFLAAATTGLGFQISQAQVPTEKIYVAVEGAGKISVLDAGERRVLTEIDLSKHLTDRHVEYLPHNVQVAPDGKTVWVTANVAGHDHRAPSAPPIAPGGRGEGRSILSKASQALDPDEVIVIDPATDSILRRIPIGADQGYYFDQPDGELVYKIDLNTSRVIKTTRAGSALHGLVVSPDGKWVYVTNLRGGDVSIIDTSTDLEVGRIAVGEEPNGISVWSPSSGGRP